MSGMEASWSRETNLKKRLAVSRVATGKHKNCENCLALVGVALYMSDIKENVWMHVLPHETIETIEKRRHAAAAAAVSGARCRGI